MSNSFPKEEIAWRLEVERRQLQNDVDIKRLQRRMQQTPDPEAGATIGGLSVVSPISLPSGTETVTGAPASASPVSGSATNTQNSLTNTVNSGSGSLTNYCIWTWDGAFWNGDETNCNSGAHCIIGPGREGDYIGEMVQVGCT